MLHPCIAAATDAAAAAAAAKFEALLSILSNAHAFADVVLHTQGRNVMETPAAAAAGVGFCCSSFCTARSRAASAAAARAAVALFTGCTDSFFFKLCLHVVSPRAQRRAAEVIVHTLPCFFADAVADAFSGAGCGAAIYSQLQQHHLSLLLQQQ